MFNTGEERADIGEDKEACSYGDRAIRGRIVGNERMWRTERGLAEL